MDITWLGHSCFRLKGKQATLITDPYPPEVGYSLGKPAAQIVTLSHDHYDHSYSQGITDSPKVIRAPGEYEISDVLIIGISTFHDSEGGNEKGKNTVYLIDLDEISVCHLGDLGHGLTAGQVEEIDDVDVLLVPVGGVYTINAPMAAALVRQLEPKVVIPMHYKTEALSFELEPVERFLEEIGARNVQPQAKLSITKSNLPLSTQVILLDYPH